MKQVKELEQTIRIVEAICLALLALCLSLPMALIFRDGSLRADLLWACGVILPVQAIRVICLRLERSRLRLLLCFGVLLLSVLIPNTPIRRIYYAACCVPILISGLFVNRPKGKILLTVPRFYFPMAALIVFALGRIGQIPLLSALAIVLAVLQIMVFLLHQNQIRLQKTVYEDVDGFVSTGGIISLNRKLFAAFLVIGILVILAIPWLFRQQAEKSYQDPLSEAEEETVIIQTPIDVDGDPVVIKEPDKPIDLSAIEDIVTVGVFLGVAVILALVAWLMIHMLRSINRDDSRHSKLKDDSFVIERLSDEPKKQKKQEEEPSTYDKKIRKRYRKRILHTAQTRDRMSAMTPTELESDAGLPKTPDREVLHEAYQKARYGPEACTKEDYQRVKESLSRLDKASE